ncbi:MAG: DUF192 domain-containing protein [Nitrososphaerota archaeon]|jgi:uncharacterized membrane protein (UPF0127 family)|nr:DUF192 domain-containing protein [Nitrososphaerota archaeon]MDG6979744.1 DUF192 domain-containing protein [Nitrososphaerota archaeon]MDG7016827.1 DUF192 domain-containing protein [Nitrososphaerota archaeon]MDG7028877.1 DUF192 domain-containing protein [Nitrososphaerota archaeon]MDG7032924.1 DUF192 domain-containing protein [Nitrososphaerota archaeon]
MKGVLLVIALLGVSGIVLLSYNFYSMLSLPGTVTTPVPSTFTVNGRTFGFNFTATTQAERESGLMNTKVTRATTMLFAFPTSGKWAFWMYDTNTSLDIIWVTASGDSGQVVYLVTTAPPCYSSVACAVYRPTSGANYVIEARGGFAAANGITIGTTIEFG